MNKYVSDMVLRERWAPNTKEDEERYNKRSCDELEQYERQASTIEELSEKEAYEKKEHQAVLQLLMKAKSEQEDGR